MRTRQDTAFPGDIDIDGDTELAGDMRGHGHEWGHELGQHQCHQDLHLGHDEMLPNSVPATTSPLSLLQSLNVTTHQSRRVADRACSVGDKWHGSK